MSREYVMTVEGPIDASELGVTLAHEHVIADFSSMIGAYGYRTDSIGPLTLENAAEARWNPGAFPDNYRLTEIDVAVAEFERLRRAGGEAVVECTPAPFRDPRALREIAQRTGIRVVMGGGYYIEPGHPPELRERTAEAIAEELVCEFADGVGDTGVRPGIIGEIGTSPQITGEEEKVLRAAAWVHRETGLPLTIHLHPWGKAGPAVLDVLESEAVDAAKVVLNHISIDVDDDRYQSALLARGVYLAFDLFGFDHSLFALGRYPPNDYEVGAKVAQLARRGYGDRVLISQDIAVRTRLVAYGGWGYAHLLDHVVPLLRSHGVDDDGIRTLLVENPRRVLAIPTPVDPAPT